MFVERSLSIFIGIIICLSSLAQDGSQQKDSLLLNFYIDSYYSYDFNKPDNHRKPGFLYHYNRHNEVTVNMALMGLKYLDPNKRANLGLMAGTYPEYNLAAEPVLFRHVYEANLGIKLSRKRELWLDVGIFPSHIGFETAIGKDNWTLTRSIVAENSPYYEAGARFNYQTMNEKWQASALLLNGWQRIKRVEGNNALAVGTQLTHTSSDKLIFNSSTFFGSDQPDSNRKWRIYHNLYSIWQWTPHWGITWGIDLGAEQRMKGASQWNIWYSPVLILRYQRGEWSMAGRVEYFSDPKSVIVHAVNSSAFQTRGSSLNIDRLFNKSILLRVEGRYLKNASKIFSDSDGLPAHSIFFLTTSLSVSFTN